MTSPATTVSWTGYTACTDHDKCGFSAGFVSYKSLKTWTGKTVLDVGAWDGFFSFEFERRGAKRVLAIDPGPALMPWTRSCLPASGLAARSSMSASTYMTFRRPIEGAAVEFDSDIRKLIAVRRREIA